MKESPVSSLITVSRQPELPPLRHVWDRCITIGRGYDLLRADLQEHLKRLQKEFGYRHIRFHASFHDDVGVVHRQENGSIVYRWTQLDHIYDFLVETGFDPIVEINSMPAALASGDQTMFWYRKNVTPPRDYAEWEAFIRAFIEHFTERYGLHRLRNWYFEVWNEPNLQNQFWTGSKEDYFQLYASCARVIKAFHKDLRVGGPSGAGAAWNLDFARFCREHSVPLDFISYHNYPQNIACSCDSLEDCPHQPGMNFVDELRQARDELAAEGFGHLPILMTEWNTQSHGKDWKARWVGNETVSNLFAGAAICHLATACDDLVDALGWWVASDVFEEAGPHFEPYGTGNQYYGMLTVDGLPKAAYHGFSFLNRMRGPRYRLEGSPEGDPTRSLLVTDEGSLTRCLIWNCQFPYIDPTDWEGLLSLPLPPTHAGQGSIRVTSAKVRAGQGSAYEYWQAMGSPPVLTAFEQKALEARTVPEFQSRMEPVSADHVELRFHLLPNEFMLIEIGGHEAVTDTRSLNDLQAGLNEQLHVHR